MVRRRGRGTWLALGLASATGLLIAARFATGCSDDAPQDPAALPVTPEDAAKRSTDAELGEGSVVDGPEPCGQDGGAAIRVGAAGATFCIDTTEISRAQYAAFLATTPTTSAQAAECAWNTTFVPNADWPDAGAVANPELPVTSVDWCDAVAYCSAFGKRLCGGVGGGPSEFEREAGAARSGEWYVACSHNGDQLFPYGTTQDPTACNGADGGSAKPVGSVARCQGGYPGLFDMTGNVQEWRNACKVNEGGAGPQDDLCRLGGGSYGTTVDNQSCETIFQGNRSGAFKDLGFRCCSAR